MSAPISLAEDRSMLVPPGAVIRTAYVAVHRVKLACRARMAVGDVDRAYQKRLQLGEAQPWPCPVGEWEGEFFLLKDGRHEYVAALMLGCQHILVAWVESAPATIPIATGEAGEGLVHAKPYFDPVHVTRKGAPLDF